MEDIIDDIYEAAAIPELWVPLLSLLGDSYQTKGGLIFANSPTGTKWLGGGEIVAIMTDFLQSGWMQQNDRVPRMMAERPPGFITDLDYYSFDQVTTMPLYTEYLIPHGVFATAGTLVTGITGDDLVFSLEGFSSHEAAREAIPKLDRLRPHFARAISIASQIGLETARTVVRTLELLGAPAAIVTSEGKLRAANELFGSELGQSLFDRQNQIKLPTETATKQLRHALGLIALGYPHGQSIPIKASGKSAARVLHVLPVRGHARDIFPNASALLVLVGSMLRSDVSDYLLNALFDLTPAEARLARGLSRGQSLGEVALDGKKSVQTARSQLKCVFEKTGTSRQLELVELLRSLALPTRQ